MSGEILSCRCGAFRWHRDYATVGVRHETDMFGGHSVTFNAPCPKCMTGPDGTEYTQEDMSRMGREFREACEHNK